MRVGLVCTRKAIVCFAIGSFVSFIPAVQAETESSGGDSWRYEFTPYVWATSQDGRVGLNRERGNGVAINQNFSDILDRLDIGGMASFEASNQRWGLLLDAIYLKVSDSGRVSGPRGLVSLSGHGDITQKLFSAAGYYRAIEGKTSLDAVLGVRYHVVDWDVKVRLSAPPPIPQISRRFDERKSWADPYVGFRVLHQLDDRWSLVGYGDVGGSSSGSDLTWQAIAGVNYNFRNNMVGKLGYRHIDYDYSSDGFKYDLGTSGFYAGLGFVW